MTAHSPSRINERRPATTFYPSSLAEGKGLAHDAGNLLGALHLYSDLLAMPGVLRPEHRHYARDLKLVAHRSDTLIRRLIGTLPGTAKRTRKPSPGAATVVRTFVPLLRSLAGPGVQLYVSTGKGLPPLPFPAETLERILVNLTRNAATAHLPLCSGERDEAPHIRIAITGDDGYLRLTVSDNGPGMPKKVTKSFLNPRPTKSGMTSGFGHRVISELVESTYGRLSLKSGPGTGTTVQIEWLL